MPRLHCALPSLLCALCACLPGLTYARNNLVLLSTTFLMLAVMAVVDDNDTVSLVTPCASKSVDQSRPARRTVW